MRKYNIGPIVAEINKRISDTDLGNLQHLRKEILGLKRLSSKVVFSAQSTFDNWAMHLGGRKELQFNIGIEDRDGTPEVRFAVAFSLARSQSLQDINVLLPNIELFNDYITNNHNDFSGMAMWHYTREHGRSRDYKPKTIEPDLIKEGTFIVLGVRYSIERINYGRATETLNQLLPLYLYTMSGGKVSSPSAIANKRKFVFRAGCTVKKSTAKASRAEKVLNIDLLHNNMQEVLFRKLATVYGSTNVGTEIPSGVDTSVDVVVRHRNEFWFYEIKTAPTAKSCIRQAIGQLLEYSYWPKNQRASKLIVVGKAKLDAPAKVYISTLSRELSIPITYEQLQSA